MTWDKDHNMQELATKIKNGLVDTQILPIIEAINSHPDYCTTSSCSGRVQVLELPKLGDKERSTVLGKWHEPVTLAQVREAIEKWSGNGVVYLLAQSPIIHVICRTIEAAGKLRNLADSSGFKYSSIRSLKEQRARSSDSDFEKITVEILSTERVDVPIAQKNKIYPDDEYLGFLVENANQCLERARDKSQVLLNNLKDNLRA